MSWVTATLRTALLLSHLSIRSLKRGAATIALWQKPQATPAAALVGCGSGDTRRVSA